MIEILSHYLEINFKKMSNSGLSVTGATTLYFWDYIQKLFQFYTQHALNSTLPFTRAVVTFEI